MEIKLTKGYFATIDDADAHLVVGYSWQASVHAGHVYARRASSQRHRHILMHRVILGLTDDSKIEADHIDGNGLNNKRANLRRSSRKQNARNRKVQQNNTSGFKGVSFHRGAQKWRAQIKVDGKDRYLGVFSTAEAAAEAYDDAAVLRYGEFAKTNKKVRQPHA